VASRRTELILELVDTWNSGDVDRFLDRVGSQFEFSPDPSFPDSGSYAGDDLRQWLRDWQGTWQGNRFEALALAEHGSAVVIDSRWHLAAKGTEDEIPVSDFTIVFWFDAEDRPRRMAAFFDRELALQEARVTG
jgi:hypothetical protein